MTKNSAHLLADMLEGTVVPENSHAHSAFGFSDIDDTDAWRRHVDALTLVRAVDDHIAALAKAGQDTSIFTSALPHWYAGLGMATTPWGSVNNKPRQVCNDTNLNMLRALGMLIDARPRLDLDEEERRSLTDVIDEARTLLADDETIDRDMRLYLEVLLDRAKFLLDNIDTYGAETLRAVALELGGAFYTQAEREPHSDKQSRWKAAAWGFVGGFMSRSGGDAAKAVGTVVKEGAKQITGS